MLKFFILSVLLFLLLLVRKKHGTDETYTVAFSFGPMVYDFIKALAVALAVALLTS